MKMKSKIVALGLLAFAVILMTDMNGAWAGNSGGGNGGGGGGGGSDGRDIDTSVSSPPKPQPKPLLPSAG